MEKGKVTPKKAGKRAAGEGTLYFSTSRKAWVGQVTMPDGRRRSVYGKSQAEAKGKRDALLRTGHTTPADTTTLAQFLARWQREVVAVRVRPSTAARYALDVAAWSGAVGKIRLGDLTPAHVQAHLNQLHDSGARPRSVAHRRAVLRSALGTALGWGMVSRNVAAGKLVSVPVDGGHRVEALTPAAARAILDAFHGHPDGPLITTALYTGMRQGELLGLRWSDIDWEGARIRVRWQLGDGPVRLVPPKSRAGLRDIPLPGPVATALRAQEAHLRALRSALGPAWSEPLPGLVFPTHTGGPQRGSDVTHRFQRALARAGLPPMRFHDLRHGLATLMRAGGADLKAVQAQLGHAQFTLTAQVYAHVHPEGQQAAIDRVAGLLAPQATDTNTCS